MSELNYTYTHVSTESTTGYFACVPSGLDAGQGEGIIACSALAALEACPNDSFLHDYVLRKLLQLDTDTLNRMIPVPPLARPVLTALIAEAFLLATETAGSMPPALDIDTLRKLYNATGFTLLCWGLRSNRQALARINRRIRENITLHRPVGDISAALSALRASPSLPRPDAALLSLKHLRSQMTFPPASPRPSPAETAELALERLLDAGALTGPEYRHTSSLAPVALLRHWPLELRVHCGCVQHTLTGEGTSWGRGFSIAEARVSCVMEMVERLSAYLCVENGTITQRAAPTPLTKATYDELCRKDISALNPDLLPLGLPYQNQQLWWMPAEHSDGSTMLVPVQAVALFCNLDEQTLLLPPISTGLATGNTMSEARRAALLEVLERDAEATTPWTPKDTFLLEAKDPLVAALLQAYKERNVTVLFRELTTAVGIPCFECSVTSPDGNIVRAAAADMSGCKAVLSALTEVPWPFPSSPPSMPEPPHTRIRKFEELPDFSTGSAAGDAALLDKLLTVHGYPPVYANLTREDLQFPVVRALVPGLELTPDTDPWCLPSRRFLERVNVC